MSAGPLRRSAAALGLLALVPIAVLLVTGALTAEEAAARAVAVVVAVVIVGRLARMVLRQLLRRVERRSADGAERSAGERVRREELPVAD